MKWFVPSFSGDLRLEPDPKDPAHTLLFIEKPTEQEKILVGQILDMLSVKGWTQEMISSHWTGKKKVKIRAPIADVGPIVVALFKPGPAVLTAVKFTDGRVETVAHHTDPEHPYRTPPKELVSENVAALARKPNVQALATVARATPCCPDCFVDAIGPATEALLAFLDEEQHRTWAEHRYVLVRGQITNHTYLLAHRHSRIAQEHGRICVDLDTGVVVHFHDWLVPPEEEVLSAMLILQHAESWLRNEATYFYSVLRAGDSRIHGTDYHFKNPFGNGDDGVQDSWWTTNVGNFLQQLIAPE